MPYEAETGDITFALTGDVILNRPVSQFREPGFLRLVELLRGADATLGNLESLYHNWEMSYGSNYIGAYQVGSPDMLEEVKWLGFDGMGAAMNHAFDCGEAGLMATLDNCRARGLRTAGVGRDLGEARSAVHVDTPVGRVGLMSACTTYNLTNVVQAGPGRHDMRGKPGISILRHDTLHTVPATEYDAMARVHEGLGLRDAVGEEELTFAGQRFRRGAEYATATRCDPDDLIDIARNVAGAKKMADFVAFSVHCHESGTTGRYYNAVHRTSVPDFLVEFCHRLIDEGCDVVFGHGPHIMRGVEIYKNRPIFYSLGNFVFNVENLDRIPAPAYRRMGFGDEGTPGDWAQRFADESLWAWAAEPACYQSVVPICEFRGGELAEVWLHPLDLGFGTRLSQRGRPVLADASVADEVFGWLQDVSKSFGTTIEKADETRLRVKL